MWKIPLEVALLISEMQAVKASEAAALSLAAIAASTFLIYVLTLVLIALFLSVFVLITVSRYRQDSREERNLSYHIGGAHFGKY